MTKEITGIWLAELALKDFAGHYFSYINSIYRVARSHQLQFCAWASIESTKDILDYFPVVPVFHALSYRSYLSPLLYFLIDPIVANCFFYHDLKSQGKKYLDKRSMVLSVTALHVNLIAWAMWLRRFRPSDAPVLVLMLHFSFYKFSKKNWSFSVIWLQAGLWMLERIADHYRIFLTTDSAILAEEYRRLTHLPIYVLPIPHTTSAKKKNNSSPRITDVIRMVSLGGMRINKGFDLLAKSIEILSKNNEFHGISFELQCYQSQLGSEGATSVTLLKRLGLSNVELIERSLDQDAYMQLLENSDVVLIPYFRDIYHANTSGIFAEALAAGKPVIVTDGTWMSDQLEHYGAGVTFRDQDVDDLSRAICEARDNYPRLAAQALERRAAWLAYHNPDNFVDELLKIVSGPESRL